MARYMKNERQSKILEIIEREAIADVEELRDALAKEGYDFDDKTIYRDVAALHLATTIRPDGHVGLATPAYVAHESLAERLSKLTVEAAVHVEMLNMFIKIRCIHGCAEAVATSVNALSLKEIFVCIVARDDVLVVCRSPEDASTVYNILGEVINK